MKKLLLGLLICPLFMFSQNGLTYPKDANLAVVSGINSDYCFYRIVSLIKSQGLDFDRIDSGYGIITTKARKLKFGDYSLFYILKVYLEKNELQVRAFATEDIRQLLTEATWSQASNSKNEFLNVCFRSCLMVWAEKISEVSNGKVVYKTEELKSQF